MTEYSEASVLTARRAAQHVRISWRDDAYEHLCILALLPSLGPPRLMLSDAPWPHGFGATVASVGKLSEGFERSKASPLQPRRLLRCTQVAAPVTIAHTGAMLIVGHEAPFRISA
jgi:hypothetical protein